MIITTSNGYINGTTTRISVDNETKHNNDQVLFNKIITYYKHALKPPTPEYRNQGDKIKLKEKKQFVNNSKV